MQGEITEIKQDLRRMWDKMDKRFDAVDARFNAIDARFDARFEAVADRFNAVDARFGGVDGAIAALRLEMREGFAALQRGRLVDKVWWLLISGALLGVMARGLKWI